MILPVHKKWMFSFFSSDELHDTNSTKTKSAQIFRTSVALLLNILQWICTKWSKNWILCDT